MSTDKLKYKLSTSAEELGKEIISEIEKSTFKKKFNLSGEVTEHGIEIYESISFAVIEPNLGPLISLNLKYIDSSITESECILTISRENGASYHVQVLLSIGIAIVMGVVGIYELVINGSTEYKFLIIPIIGLCFFLIIKLLAVERYKSLISKIERLMKARNINFSRM